MTFNITKPIIKTVLGGILVSYLAACGSSNGSSNNNNNNNVSSQYALQIGNVGTIPTNEHSLGMSYPLSVFNNSNQKIYITNVEAEGVAQTIQNKLDNGGKLFNFDTCKDIAAKSMCTIQVNSANLVNKDGVGDNGQYALKITAMVNGKEVVQHRVIGYQNFNISAENNGVYYNPSNITTSNILSSTAYTGVTIPVYFDKEQTNVKLNNAGINASLVGCGVPDQNGVYAKIPAHTSCALTANYTGGNNSFYNVRLVANYQGSGIKAANAGDSNQTIMNVGLTNNLQAQGIMTTASVSNFLPSDGTTLQTITFVNIGSGPAEVTNARFYANGSYLSFGTNVTIPTTTTTATVTNNTCTTGIPIATNGSCSVTFYTNGTSFAGGLDTVLNYTTGLGNGTGTTFYNIYYYAPSSQANLSSTATGNFTNVSLSTTESITVTVLNTGPSTVTLLPSGTPNPQLVAIGNPGVPSSMSIANNTCGTSLLANTTCQYTVRFAPQTIESGANLSSVISGYYTDRGTQVNLSSSVNVPYSTNINTNFIKMNPDPLQINAPVGESVFQVVSIFNESTAPVSNLTFNSLPNGLSVGANTCTGKTLAQNESCLVTFIYAPTQAVSESQNINIAFNMGGTASPGDILPTYLTSTNSNVNLQIANVTATYNGPGGAPAMTGDGTLATPYSFFNYGDSLTTRIRYINNGTQTASALRILGETIPTATQGFSYQDNCSGQSLAQGEYCDLFITSINPHLVNTLEISGNLNFAIPAISYTDQSESISYILNNMTNPNGGSHIVYSNVTPTLVEYVVVGSGFLKQIGNNSFYVYSIGYTNNAVAQQTVGINIKSTAPASASPYGFSNSGITPSSGQMTYSTNLAGGQTQNLYLWIPMINNNIINGLSNSAGSMGNLQSIWSYNNSNNNYILNSISGALNGVIYYTTGGSVITGGALVANVVGNTGVGGWLATISRDVGTTITQLLQNSGYLYAISNVNNGIYKMTITPWNTSGSTYYVDQQTTGQLGTPSTIINDNYTPSYMAITQVSSTKYAAVSESNSQNVYIYTVNSDGTFTDAGTFNLSGLGTNIQTVAVSPLNGNLYISTTESNVIYYCGTVTLQATCSAITMPSFAATTAINYLSVTATQTGNVIVTPSVARVNGVIPNTRQYYTTDINNGITSSTTWTTLSGSTTYTQGVPMLANRNLNPTQLNPMFGLVGAFSSNGTTYSNSFPLWSESSLQILPHNLSGIIPNNIALSVSTAIYSFISVNGQN